jgi:hypothetical protein
MDPPPSYPYSVVYVTSGDLDRDENDVRGITARDDV